MDAKQACDKLHGFNFQNRYLVGKFLCGTDCSTATDMAYSLIPSAGEDEVKRGPGCPQGEFRTAQTPARDRITKRRAGGDEDNYTDN